MRSGAAERIAIPWEGEGQISLLYVYRERSANGVREEWIRVMRGVVGYFVKQEISLFSGGNRYSCCMTIPRLFGLINGVVIT